MNTSPNRRNTWYVVVGTWRAMSLRIIAVFIILAVVSACAVVRTPSIVRMALLAPFEGRYREVGYNALYAARLGFCRRQAILQVDLLAVDDGGTQAANRAQR